MTSLWLSQGSQTPAFDVAHFDFQDGTISNPISSRDPGALWKWANDLFMRRFVSGFGKLFRS
jgi:hypothetical protein